MGRTVGWALLNYLIFHVVSQYSNIGDTLKQIVKAGLIAQIVLHVAICVLDPGTLFEDEEDTHAEERTFCTTCRLYRRRSSKHCIWCQKCTMWYDHHCSVFGKCIGKRNIVPFYLFIMVCGMEMPGLIVITILNLASSF